ncbi:glycosyltransferase family 39 protein [Frondihabitans cladoniiphilus]|uniref:Glycosyltransferase family 39 protein n=1 Tax=Frondihabitans cladoniiphilus TaxID=715785 RepID=A0ABP8W8F4_9MICO
MTAHSPVADPATAPPRTTTVRTVDADDRGRVREPAIIAVFGALVAFAWSWTPSLWFDEAATVVAATRPWPDLARMLTTVDAVHATYYSFMHVWFDLFTYTPVTLRLPSALAVGIAAGLTAVLGRMLAGRRVGLLAGLLFCVIPRVTWMGGEGRSFALATLLCVVASILFLTAWRRTTAGSPSARWWVAYTVVALLSCAVFLYVALVVVGHGVTALVLTLRRDRSVDPDEEARPSPDTGAPDTVAEAPHRWRPALRWAVAAVITAVGCIPLARLSSDQSKQISWITRPTLHAVSEVFTTQWFPGNTWFATLAWLLMAAGFVFAIVRSTRAKTTLLALALPWIFVPTLGLIAYSLVRTPLYSPRYVSFAAPGVAILMALGLSWIRPRLVIAAVVVVSIMLSVPTYLAQRQPTAKDASAWNEVAALVAKQRALEKPGSKDAVVYGPVRRHPATTSRIIQDTYPSAFTGIDDITLDQKAEDTDGLWSTQYPLEDVLDKTAAVDTVWLITSDKNDWRPRVTADLATEGFHVDEQWHFSRTNVVRYEK